MEFRIERAVAEDTPLIAKAVFMALHLDDDQGGNGLEEMKEWHGVFEALAARDDSQYSYRNTIKAVTPDGTVAGMLVSYDGARLHALREAFFKEVKERIGKDMRGMADETDAGEWYLDSLAVWPEFRGCGIGRKLIAGGEALAKEAGKPAGLLVDKTNEKARALYESLGFRKAGERYFADVLMDHLILQNH